MAETFYVTPEMARVVTARAEAWPDDEIVSIDELPSAAGFVYVPHGIWSTYTSGNKVCCDVFAWHRVGNSLQCYWMISPVMTYPGMEKPKPGEMETIPLSFFSYDMDGPCAARTVAQFDHELPEELQLDMGLDLTMFTKDPLDKLKIGPKIKLWMIQNDVTLQEVPDFNFIWLFSCLRLMREELPAVSRVGTPANLRKGMIQRKMKNTHVTVIEHRRRAAGDDLGGTHEYNYRFYRRGHNRRVWAKNPETGELEQRTVWIKPVIVNSARTDLPLLMREHINSLSR
jgi:hypothetical protein